MTHVFLVISTLAVTRWIFHILWKQLQVCTLARNYD